MEHTQTVPSPPGESEERFRLLVESVQDYAIFMLDPGGYITSWNRGAERIKGYQASEIIGKHFSTFYSADEVAQGKPEWELRAAGEIGRMEDEGWRIRKDGTRFWANVVITALRGPDGALRGFAKVTRDLTDRRAIEALHQAARHKDEFLALLAHELRNPLAPIRSALEVLSHPRATADSRRRAHEIAQRQISHMAHLLDDLIDIARIGEGKLGLTKEVVDVAMVAAQAVDSVQSSVIARRQDLVVKAVPDTVWVHADPVRLHQILVNLLGNAAKYTEPEGRITLSTERVGDKAVVRVWDTGIGIDPAIAPYIFDLFVQAERRVDGATGGIGVGLTLVKRLVELHGGTVSAWSPGRGMGTELVVRLPAVERPSDSRAGARELATRSSREGLRMLVVDDNVDSADSMAMWLETQGHVVSIAYDGESALEIVPSLRPDVAILDIGMAGMDGYELARRLRSAPETGDMVIIALTGWGQEEDVRKAVEAGFDHHVVKPVDLALLSRLLLTRRRER